MLLPRANEIPRLVRRLGSTDPARADAARARLAVLGPRAVEDLVRALEGGDRRVRLRVMPLLAMIQDSRGRAPLLATLLDDDPALRELAAECLARFPAADVVLALERTLARDREGRVRIAAVRALVEQCSAGRDDAVRRPLEILLDPAAGRPLRVAAFALLRSLPAAQQSGILERLVTDADDEIRRLAADLPIELSSAREPVTDRVSVAIADLASPDYRTWNAAVARLARGGSAVVPALVAEIGRRPAEPEFATRAGMALKALGRRHAQAIADAVDEGEDLAALPVLVDVIGAIGEPALVYRLAGLLDRLPRPDSDPGVSRLRAKAHLALAKIGSRVAIQDLRAALADPNRPVDLELLAAIGLVGTRDEIPLLLGALSRAEPFVGARIADAVRTIVKRERIRSDAPALERLGDRDREALGRILSRAAPRPARHRPGRPARDG
jgi:HEAT repeat protein